MTGRGGWGHLQGRCPPFLFLSVSIWALLSGKSLLASLPRGTDELSKGTCHHMSLLCGSLHSCPVTVVCGHVASTPCSSGLLFPSLKQALCPQVASPIRARQAVSDGEAFSFFSATHVQFQDQPSVTKGLSFRLLFHSVGMAQPR